MSKPNIPIIKNLFILQSDFVWYVVKIKYFILELLYLQKTHL